MRLNTDAIDNSAGVNTSDVEVNIKIALSPPLRSGALTIEARNALLVEMTDEVARLVLRNNYQQTLALSLAQRRGLEDLGFQQRLMQTLEAHGELDRAVEFLPDDMALSERRKRNAALTRPELAVLLAYAKLSLYSDLLASSVPDDPYLGRELERYFPKEMSERYADALHAHRLRREIIATQLTNSMINRGGATLIVRIADQTGASAAQIAAAFAAVRNSYDMVALNSEIDALDNKIAGKVAARSLCRGAGPAARPRGLVPAQCRSRQGLETVIAHYRDGIAQVAAALDGALSRQARRRARRALRGARQGRRAGRARAPHRRSGRAQGRARYRAGGGPRRQTGRPKSPRPISPPRPSSSSTASSAPCRASWWRNISTAWRSTARSIRSAMPSGASPPPWSATAHGRRRRGGGMGEAAAGRSRAHPRRHPRNRRLRADAVEALGGGEFAGGFGAE